MQAAKGAEEERAAAAEHLEELSGRIAQRQRWLADESSALEKKIADAQRPILAERQACMSKRDGVAARVEELRSAPLQALVLLLQLHMHNLHNWHFSTWLSYALCRVPDQYTPVI